MIVLLQQSCQEYYSLRIYFTYVKEANDNEWRGIQKRQFFYKINGCLSLIYLPFWTIQTYRSYSELISGLRRDH